MLSLIRHSGTLSYVITSAFHKSLSHNILYNFHHTMS